MVAQDDPARRWAAWLVAGAMVTGCGTTSDAQPEAMSARAHRRAAEEHLARAVDARREYAAAGYTAPTNRPGTYVWSADIAAEAAEARTHLRSAELLEKEHRQSCLFIAPVHQARCPLDTWLLAVSSTETGTVMHFPAEAGPADVLLMELRCHRAWMAVEGPTEMRHCPLGVRGLDVTVTAARGAVDVTLTPRDRKDLPDLRRRVDRMRAGPTASR